MAGRAVYKLGEHRLRVLVIDAQAGTRRRQYISVPILTRCLEKTGELLKLEKATDNDLRTIKRIKTRPRVQEGEGSGGGQGGQQPGQGGQQPGQGGQQPGQGGQQPGGQPEGEIREVIYYREGSWRADSIRLVYKEEISEEDEGQGGNQGGQGGNQGGQGGNQGGQGGNQGGQGGNQGGQGGGEEEQRYKLRTLHIPIPSWAPNYKVVPVLFSKARSANLKVVGAYRKGNLIPAPQQRN